MFESLREAFRQALENFNSELNRDRIPEAADRLLRAMKAELVELQRQSDEIQKDLDVAHTEARREQDAARTCLRREAMALKIGDQETASLAHEYAGKHLRRHEILTEKTEVLARELEERRRNLEEMTSQFREARIRRESLAATAGRSETRDQIRDAQDLFDEMDRMARRIQDLEAGAGAAQELDEALGRQAAGDTDEWGEEDLEARLEALKRRMGEA